MLMLVEDVVVGRESRSEAGPQLMVAICADKVHSLHTLSITGQTNDAGIVDKSSGIVVATTVSEEFSAVQGRCGGGDDGGGRGDDGDPRIGLPPGSLCAATPPGNGRSRWFLSPFKHGSTQFSSGQGPRSSRMRSEFYFGFTT